MVIKVNLFTISLIFRSENNVDGLLKKNKLEAVQKCPDARLPKA
jgi:hypothetical protein